MATPRKANPKNPLDNLKGGSRKGRPNKLGRLARENIAEVFSRIGGIDGMVEWAEAHKTEFYCNVYPKLLPLEVKAELAGKDGAPLAPIINLTVTKPDG